MADLKRTGLYDLHIELGAKMVPFAGYEMPVQYPLGVMKEHLHCRAHVGLFDVGHMGQVILRPKGDMAALVVGLEAMMPVAVAGLAEGRQRYGMFTNDQGGIIDDLMFANRGDHFFLVVNAGCRDGDIALMREKLADVAEVTEVMDRGLLAVQGPGAEAALSSLVPDVAAMRFMDVITVDTVFGALWISRSGYTGEDGFEVSVPDVDGFTRSLLALEGVEMIGLGARDSLRLESGLCLYGHDMTEDITPAEAALGWAISKARRQGDRAGGFPGADVILAQLADGSARLRVGLRPETRAPMREGVELYDREEGGEAVGYVTSGGFGPSVEVPIAMGYVPRALAADGTQLWGEVRGKRLPVSVFPLPFRPSNYKR
ncbi:glycine cleavage system aminomethyltransferase GcvT (plasmid) [Pseudorhodobacter turbinis]|uniref:aminomethyltransferase n=1 Tax=Pseudorhodobacter turbinis TaxID=2500533 RepID=A0A4P8EI66_9RHOB|nr:glycine cleavage system aminomethyltransferase GcvT [Pseudorhodobacter turbinis]QCO56666.1 glycine cleavage system aminomethyltransferase GcvT [Pseudorhodobacter turbinis]